MYKIGFIILLIFLLFIVNFYVTETFNVCHQYGVCSEYNTESGTQYSKCYNSNKCSVMIDLLGNAFCTSKNS